MYSIGMRTDDKAVLDRDSGGNKPLELGEPEKYGGDGQVVTWAYVQKNGTLGTD